MKLIDPNDIKFVIAPIAPILIGEQVHFERVAFQHEVSQIPRIDAEPMKHGVWFGTVCSCCGESTSDSYDCEYCPHCGAKMVEYEDYESESGEGENHEND